MAEPDVVPLGCLMPCLTAYPMSACVASRVLRFAVLQHGLRMAIIFGAQQTVGRPEWLCT